MRKKKIWPWLGGVLAVVVGGLLVEWLWEIKVIHNIGSLFKWIWNIIVYPVTLPLWLLVVIIAAVAGVTWLSLGKGSIYSAHYEYVRDEIMGLKWEWAWHGGLIYNLIFLCPKCSYQLFVDKTYNYEGYDGGSMVNCPNCDFNNTWQISTEEFEDRALREIQRRIRTGQYKLTETAPK